MTSNSMSVGTAFAGRVVAAQPQAPLGDVAELMQEHNVGCVVLVDDAARPVGIVTDRDLALELGTGRVVRSEPARVIMSHPVATIGHREGILAATKRMRDGALRRLPVVNDEGRVVGLVSLDDLLGLLGQEVGNLAQGVGRELAAAGSAPAS